MNIEAGKTYFGHDTSRLRVYRLNETAGEVVVEHPILLQQRVMNIPEFEAWAKEPYIPVEERA